MGRRFRKRTDNYVADAGDHSRPEGDDGDSVFATTMIRENIQKKRNSRFYIPSQAIFKMQFEDGGHFVESGVGEGRDDDDDDDVVCPDLGAEGEGDAMRIQSFYSWREFSD